MKSSICLIWMLALGLIGLAACSRHEEPPPPASASQPAPAMAEPLRSATPAASAPAIPEAPAASAGADLEKVAEQAAAFSDLLDSLRKFGGEETDFNAETLDLAAFVRGKSDHDLLKFVEAVQYKSPFAAMQVLDYLATQAADPKLRMRAAWRYADLAGSFGDANDRARAKGFYDRLAACRGDDAFVAALSDFDRSELLTAMQRLIITLRLDEPSSFRQLAGLLRDHPTSDEDLSIADWFDAMALYRSDRKDDLVGMMAYLRAIRARGVYGRFFAQKEIVDRWLSRSIEEVQAEHAEFKTLRATYQPKIDARQRKLDALSPAERLAEMRRKNPAD